MSAANIYKFFGPAVFVPPEEALINKNLNFDECETKKKYKYKCLYCDEHGIKDRFGQTVYISSFGTTTSNLIHHLKKENHSQVFKEYEEINTTKLDSLHFNKKAKLNNNTTIGTACNIKLNLSSTPTTPSTPKQHSLNSIGFVAASPRYKINTILHKSRLVNIFLI